MPSRFKILHDLHPKTIVVWRQVAEELDQSIYRIAEARLETLCFSDQNLLPAAQFGRQRR
jgi:hypothetical protein